MSMLDEGASSTVLVVSCCKTLTITGGSMEFFEVVTTQRATRRLKPDPIPEALLQQIMDAAICAPSGGNRQGWSFVLVRDPNKRKRLGELYREAWDELMKV